MVDETSSFLFSFKKTETLWGLVTAILASPLVFPLLKSIFSQVPCQATLFSTNNAIWVPALPIILLIFWAVIGFVRFVRNEQRQLGSLGNITRVGHLTFLLPTVILLPIFMGIVGLILAGIIVFILLIEIAYKVSDPSLVVYLMLLSSHVALGILVHLALYVLWFFNLMWCLL